MKPTLDAQVAPCAVNATHICYGDETDEVHLELNPGLTIVWYLGRAGGVLPTGANVGEVIVERQGLV